MTYTAIPVLAEIECWRGRMQIVIAESSMLPLRDGDELLIGIQEGWLGWTVLGSVRQAAFWLAENVDPALARRVVAVKVSDLVPLRLIPSS